MEGKGVRTCSHLKKSKEKKKPDLLSLRFLDYRTAYKSPRIFLIYPISPFPSPLEIPKVWIYSVRSKPVALITDKTEFVIQRILRLWSLTIVHFGKIAPVHFEYRFAALCHSNDVISLKEINVPLFF